MTAPSADVRTRIGLARIAYQPVTDDDPARATVLALADDAAALLAEVETLRAVVRDVLAMADDLATGDGPHPSHDHHCPDDVADRLRSIVAPARTKELSRG